MIVPKKANYFSRIYDFSFENMKVWKKVNYLFRKHDLLIQDYANVTPNWDELAFLNAFEESS